MFGPLLEVLRDAMVGGGWGEVLRPRRGGAAIFGESLQEDDGWVLHESSGRVL